MNIFPPTNPCTLIFNFTFVITALSGSPAVLIAVAIVLIFQMIFTYTPAMQLLFATQPLDLASWAVIVPVAASVLVLVELEKFFFRHSDQLRRFISD